MVWNSLAIVSVLLYTSDLANDNSENKFTAGQTAFHNQLVVHKEKIAKFTISYKVT